MRAVSAGEVRSFLLARFADSLSAQGIEASAVADDFDLLSRGVIDSLGILEMISAVEEEFGLKLDLEELDPEQLTLIGPFCHFIEVKSREGGAESMAGP